MEELREKIAERLYHIAHQGRAGVFIWESCPSKGYYYDEADEILEAIKQDGWVRLAEDQSSPAMDLRGQKEGEWWSGYGSGCIEAQEAMLKAGFRKTE